MGETVGATNALFAKRYTTGPNAGCLRPVWVGYGLFADLADSLPSLSVEDRNLLALTAYAVTYATRGDWKAEEGDWEAVGVANFMRKPRLPDGRSLAEAGCRSEDVQFVTFTYDQASEALGYKSRNGVQKTVKRALEVGRLYLARSGSKGHASLYAVGPIVWEPGEYEGMEDPIVVYSKPRKSNTFLRLKGRLQDVLQSEGPDGVRRYLEESWANKAEIDRILGREG